MQTRRDYYQKRYSYADSRLLQSHHYWRYFSRAKRLSYGKIEPNNEPSARQRSPSVAAIRTIVSGPNELLPPTRAASSLMLHPGEFHDHQPRRLSVNLGKHSARSQPTSPDHNPIAAKILS